MDIPRIERPHVFMRLARACLRRTERFLEAHPIRTAGQDECVEAGHDLRAAYADGCDAASAEEFPLRTGALWHVGKVVAVSALLGAALSVVLVRWYTPPWTFLVYVGVLCCVVGLVYALVVYLFFSSAFDFLFRERVGCNVVGEVKPAGPVTRQVVLVAHHDAPYVFSFLEHTESLANIRFILASVGFTWILGYGACLGVRFALGHPHVPDGVWLWITVGCLVAAFQLWFMITSTPSPGAGDNLNSSFMALTLARYFVWHRNHGHPLEQTRLVLLSTGAEECGERGAKAYLRAHGDELRATPSYVINLDTVVHPDDLAVLTRDRNSTVGLSSAMVADVCAVANWLGIAITAKPFRLGAGATDAWPFAKVARGVTGIVGSSLAIVARGHTYHTSRDLVGAINAAAVRDALMISAAYIRMVDAQPA